MSLQLISYILKFGTLHFVSSVLHVALGQRLFGSYLSHTTAAYFPPRRHKDAVFHSLKYLVWLIRRFPELVCYERLVVEVGASWNIS